MSMRVAVIGMGPRGRYLARAFDERPETEVTAVCENSPGAAGLAREQLGSHVRHYTDYRDMCDSEEFEIGVVASWDPAHREHAVALLQRNKHVYLEKPMAQSIEDCDAILRAWERSGGVLVVGLELRHSSLCIEMKRLIEAGEIGRVVLGNATDNVSVGGNYYFHGRRRRKDFIVSLILEKGTHTLDLMNWFIGSTPVRVFGEGGLDVFGGEEDDDRLCRNCELKSTCPYFIDQGGFASDYGEELRIVDRCVYAREIDVHDNSVITVAYENGARMSYTECHFTPDYNRHFTLIGDEGRLYGFYNNEQEFVIRVQKRHSATVVEHHPQRSAGGHGGGDPRIISEFIRLAELGEHSCPGALDARNSAAIAIAAAESCDTHLPVTIPSFSFEHSHNSQT